MKPIVFYQRTVMLAILTSALIVLLALVCTTTSAAPTSAGSTNESRQWRDASGNILAIGQFISVMGDSVCLETSDGLGAVIPLAKLSPADRKFVDAQSGADLTLDETPKPRDVAGIPQAYDQPSTNPDELLDSVRAYDAAPSTGPDAYTQQRIVIPVDFVSNFDDGRYGQMVGDMFWKKLDREGGVVIPDSMDDVRAVCEMQNLKIGPDTPLDEMKRIITKDFAADIAIWGQVERVKGFDWDVYDLTIRCYDFSNVKGPQLIYEVKNVRTQTVSEIPHLYGSAMLDKLYGREPGQPAPPNPVAEKNWAENPNLVLGGDFERAAGRIPYGWDAGGGQMRDPVAPGNQVSWVSDTSNPSNKVIRFTFGPGVGNGYGVMYYSKSFPIEEGAKYRFECRYRTNGPAVKVFIKCYDMMDSAYKTNTQLAEMRSGRYVPDERQMRECYRSQQNLKGGKNQWNVQSEDFTPKHTKYTPQWGKVMLYAYLGGGVVEFDDVVVKQILPGSASESKKDPRHSLESTVTLEEMRANEERAREKDAKNPLLD